MVDLRANPYFLSDEDVQWVEQTAAAMTEDEKIWQLFADPLMGRDQENLIAFLAEHPLGACPFRAGQFDNATARKILGAVQDAQKIPMLITADCGTGADGRLKTGTLVGTAAQAGAAPDNGETAYDIGSIACKELGAVGFNWAFEPVGDILLNWRNCLVNTRAFSSDPDRVITCVDQFLQAAKDNNFLPCLKHFPGDGWEERDQHIVEGNNGLSCEEWDATFGKVYQHCIDRGVPTIMVGHFTLPAYQKKLNPALRDADMTTACTSKELITGLLRQQLGFHGLVVTDQTTMMGFYSLPRTKALPACIEAGCDMILGINDVDEDFACMKEAVQSGQITAERLNDALYHILGAKAMIGLHRRKAEYGTLTPPEEQLACICSEEHRQAAIRAADKAITLVKDTRRQLPIRPETHKKILLHVLGGAASKSLFGTGVASGGASGLPELIKELLEKQGFEVTIWSNDVFGTRRYGTIPGSFKGVTKESAHRFDAVLLFADVSQFATTNAMRLVWPSPMCNIMPWYVAEGVPVAFISLNLTNHMIDVPRVPIFINAYNHRPETIELVIRKLMGDSPFTGRYEETVFCGQWDTHF